MQFCFVLNVWKFYRNTLSARSTVVENILEFCSSAVKTKMRTKAYKIPTSQPIPEVGEAPTASMEKPKYQADVFQLCYPRSNLQLPLKISAAEQCKGLMGVTVDVNGEAISWAKLEQSHNEEFNPTGKPYDPSSQGEKRSASEPAGLGLGEKVTVDPSPTPENLIQTGVIDKEGCWQILFCPNESSLYLKALKDGGVTPELPLFTFKGAFQAGSRAEAEMKKEGAQFIDSGMSAQTMVQLSQATGSLELPTHPIKLEDALKALTALRAAVGEIFKHKFVEKNGGYEVTACEAIAFMLEVSNKAPDKVINPATVSTHIDVAKCTHIGPIQAVKYEPHWQTAIKFIFLVAVMSKNICLFFFALSHARTQQAKHWSRASPQCISSTASILPKTPSTSCECTQHMSDVGTGKPSLWILSGQLLT